MPGSPTDPFDDTKMVLVIRGELRLTTGKAAVQAAHAAVLLTEKATRLAPSWVARWRKSGQKKIAVVAPSLDDLESLERKAARAGIPSVLVEDAGLTEVAPGTKTCLGLGPAPSQLIDPITRSLALL